MPAEFWKTGLRDSALQQKNTGVCCTKACQKRVSRLEEDGKKKRGSGRDMGEVGKKGER